MPIDKTTRIVYIVGVVLILLCIAVGSTLVYKAYLEKEAAEKELADARAAVARVPVYEWQKASTQTLVISPGSVQVWGIVQGSKLNQDSKIMQPRFVRYDVISSEPVDTGVMDAAFGDVRGRLDLGDMADFYLQAAACLSRKVLQSQQTCRLVGDGERGGFIVVKDARRPTTSATIGAVAGAYFGAKEPLQHMAAENRVTVTFYAWQCIQNCIPQK